MRRQNQQIRLFRRRLPALHPVRKLALAEYKDLVDLQPRCDARILDQTEMRLSINLHQRMIVVAAPLDDRLPFAVYLFFDCP